MITESDILLAAELALPHRLRRKPFEEIQTKMEKLEQRLEHARAAAEEPEARRADLEALSAAKKKRNS